MFLYSLKLTLKLRCAARYFQYYHCGDFVITDFGSVTKSMRGLVGMDRTVCGDGQNGSELVQGWVGMGVKSVWMGGGRTKILSHAHL